MIKVGDKVRIFPKIWDDVKKEWTFEGNEKSLLYGKVGWIRSVGVIPTVWFKAHTNYGKWWYGVDEDEMVPVPDDTEVDYV